MSNYIPFDIQAKIMKNLPSKSLIQFRSVSKTWKSLIDSTEFIADHHRHTHQRHNYLLIRDFEHKYVSVVDDETFPQHKLSLTPPMSAKLHPKPRIVGSSQGLFCLYGYVGQPSDSIPETAAIWNPAIRKLVDVGGLYMRCVDRNMFDEVTFGFGVCPHTLDPKIVIVSIPWLLTDSTWQVEVFSLSLGGWTSPSVNLPLGTTEIRGNQVAIDRFIYWPAMNTILEFSEYHGHVIVSFDLTSEEFTLIHLPDSMALNREIGFHIYELKESLAVIQSDFDLAVTDFDVWVMENGAAKSFNKMYSIRYNTSITSVLEFRNSGEPIVLFKNSREPIGSGDYKPCEVVGENHLSVYEPNAKHINYIGISSEKSSFFVSSYTETLLLLDYRDSLIYATYSEDEDSGSIAEYAAKNIDMEK